MHRQLKLNLANIVVHQVVTTSKQPNRRVDTRLDICLKVEVTYDDGHSATFCTKNMSTTGLFLEKGDNELPEIGTIIHVKVSAELGMQDAPLVKAEVARITDDGIGIMFLSP